MITSRAVEQVCADQFEGAVYLDKRYVHAVDADDYYFGGIARSGLATLQLLPDVEMPTVLDIGAGYGTFLREAMAWRDGKVRAIGFTAISNNRTVDEDIEWVFGDFQRPDTWQPSDTIQPESVDLAVASLTFQHFAHPLSGIESAYNSLRIGGHLLIDSFEVVTDPAVPETLDNLLEELKSNLGRWGANIGTENGTVYGRTLHLEKKSDQPIFSEIEAIAEEGDDQVYYRLTA